MYNSIPNFIVTSGFFSLSGVPCVGKLICGDTHLCVCLSLWRIECCRTVWASTCRWDRSTPRVGAGCWINKVDQLQGASCLFLLTPQMCNWKPCLLSISVVIKKKLKGFPPWTQGFKNCVNKRTTVVVYMLNFECSTGGEILRIHPSNPILQLYKRKYKFIVVLH